MQIVVCIKQIPNPDIAPSVFRIDEATKKVIAPSGMSLVINPFDEQAVEAAIQIRENSANADAVTITILTLSEEVPVKMVKHALALGADEGVMLSGSAFAGSDSYATAKALAAAIRKLGSIDLVVTGRQAADSDSGVVGLGIAELLDLPAITLAKKIKISGNEVIVERVVGDGEETVVAPIPAVVTIAHEFGAVRYPSLRETMRAGKKPVRNWDIEMIGMTIDSIGKAVSRSVIERLYRPIRETNCEWLDSDNTIGAAKALTSRLIEQKLI
jgi:electron transfer flavoprotein beta subunit